LDDVNPSSKTIVGSYTIPTEGRSGQVSYVLDGYQRLSTLFGCLTNPERTDLKRDEDLYQELFSVYYNLKDESFEYLRPHVRKPNNYQIPLYVLMSSKDFRQYTRLNLEQNLFNDEYLDRADDLTRVFIDYQIPVIEIANADIDEAVEIFSRINSKGTDISYDWIVNALSFRENEFRFADVIDSLKDELSEYNFDGIGRNALFRCFQSSFGKSYLDQKNIEELAKRDDFADVVKDAAKYIKRAVKYLYEELNVVDSKLLPYNFQLIFFMEFFKRLPEPTKGQLKDLNDWFWITTYSNFFTNNSISSQRKAYNTFIDYLEGRSEKMLNCESHEYSALPIPDCINLSTVRSKALILFCLNRFTTHSEDKGFVQRKIFGIDKISNAEYRTTKNILFSPYKSYFSGINNENDIFSNMSEKDRENLFFVDQEGYELYKNGKNEKFLQRRWYNMGRSEKEFICAFECFG